MRKALICSGLVTLYLIGCGGGLTQNSSAASDTRVTQAAPVHHVQRKAGAPDLNEHAPSSMGTPASVFLNAVSLANAKEKIRASSDLFDLQNQQVQSRAAKAANMELKPFRMDNIRDIVFGWCQRVDYTRFDTLKEATEKFQTDSDHIRSLALNFVLNGVRAHGDKAVKMMESYGLGQSLVNLHDLDVNYQQATLLGRADPRYCDELPWNFALDAMWQSYGLINIADAYLLLKSGGYTLSDSQDAALREWILKTTEAVNASFHAWTRWADLHPNSRAYRRYRSDNHLSWALLGLLAAATALQDDALAHYVLQGGTWTDRRSGSYKNPSSIRQLIDLAIASDGMIYEEEINRDPPIGYSLFHLWPMTMIAHIANLHYDDNLWEYRGKDGAGLYQAYQRYADFLLGQTRSPLPKETASSLLSNYGWLFQFAAIQWGDKKFNDVLEKTNRNKWIIQGPGPVLLIIQSDADKNP